MIKFKSFNESFDQPYAFKKMPSKDGLMFKADVGDKKLIIHLSDRSEWYVGIIFSLDNADFLTGEGNAFRIFATVKKVIFDNLSFVKKFNNIQFQADNSETSRVKLYNLIGKQLAKKLGLSLKIRKQTNYTDYIIADKP